MSIEPIFLLSLPRAGSTLLQRLLSQHDKISTTPEPWIALPLFFALKSEGVSSIYSHKALSHAVEGFSNSLPNGRNDYLAQTAEYLKSLYSLSSDDNATFFLDKTPRYHLIADDLMEAFPDAKFIFLWRNPLAIVSSITQTWAQGKWNTYMFWVDLYQGMESLINCYNKNRHRAIALKYEDLATTPKIELDRIMTYLGLDIDNDILTAFNKAKKMDAPGRGDPTGQHKFDTVSNQSLSSWKEKMANPFRKQWSINYLQWLGKDRLCTMGYDIQELISEIENQKSNYTFLISDLVRHFYGKIYCRYPIDQARKELPWKNIYLPKS